MLITRMDMVNDPDLGNKIKRWVASLNLAAKTAGGAPVFTINGPCTLKVRTRKGATAVNESFSGGEEFRCTAVVAEKQAMNDTIKIMAIFAPKDLNLASYISSLTLDLSDAHDLMSGFEEWVKVESIKRQADSPEEKAKSAPLKKLPSIEETRASETWGAW